MMLRLQVQCDIIAPADSHATKDIMETNINSDWDDL